MFSLISDCVLRGTTISEVETEHSMPGGKCARYCWRRRHNQSINFYFRHISHGSWHRVLFLFYISVSGAIFCTDQFSQPTVCVRAPWMRLCSCRNWYVCLWSGSIQINHLSKLMLHNGILDERAERTKRRISSRLMTSPHHNSNNTHTQTHLPAHSQHVTMEHVTDLIAQHLPPKKTHSNVSTRAAELNE